MRARETHPGAGTRVTFGEAVVDFDASRAVGAYESQGSEEHAAIVREIFRSDRSNRSKRADAGAKGAEDETVHEEREGFNSNPLVVRCGRGDRFRSTTIGVSSRSRMLLTRAYEERFWFDGSTDPAVRRAA